MSWQDLVITLASVGFVIGLIEQIYEILKSKQSSLSLISCSIYALGLYAMTYAMHTLDLLWSSIFTGLNAILWTTLLILSYKYRFNKIKN